ncbi:MAG: ComF family protein [Magnetococcales bacterium]|nr:ComF family protein [Magnetococcales bacterium]
MSNLIVRFKFSDRTEWSENLTNLLLSRVGAQLLEEEPDMVIPVPLHPLRLLRRGYNQAALLAGRVARKIHRPLVTNLLYRTKMTRPQTSLNQKSRLVNVHDAFVVGKAAIENRRILLVDDVFTTGSTVWSATRALKEAGAGRVMICCLARVEY